MFPADGKGDPPDMINESLSVGFQTLFELFGGLPNNPVHVSPAADPMMREQPAERQDLRQHKDAHCLIRILLERRC